jgi:hypothetical protein
MAAIQISDLQVTGAALFTDSESYLNALNTEEMEITGGLVCCPVSIPRTTITPTFPITITIPRPTTITMTITIL